MRLGHLVKIFAFILAASILSGCGPKYDQMSPKAIYDLGEEKYTHKNYSDAIEAYEALIDHYPFSVYVTQAELKIADAYYAKRRYAEAATAYEDFLEKHPTNDSVPHVLHYLGLSHYDQKRAIDRDQTETHAAEQTLSRLVTQYPDYMAHDDAKTKLAEARKDLAARERYIARFYWREKEYYASLMRFERVVRDYSDTIYYPEALYYAGACLVELDEKDEAKRYFDILQAKFPDHKYTKKARGYLNENSK
jgi:outer membrane protein assembly factor BamD